MKLKGIFGKGSGKLGSSVFAISGGEQIVREYNPQVSNPNTDAQVAQRAKLKLMSQLAASLAGVLAFRKQGLVSARNQFVSRNIGFASFSNGQAVAELLKLQLTPGNSVLGSNVTITRSNEAVIVNAVDVNGNDIAKVVLVVCRATEGSQVQVLDIQIKDAPAGNNIVSHSFYPYSGNLIAYAYGLKSGSGSTSINYDDYEVIEGPALAGLIANGTLAVSSSNLTQTMAALLD